MPWWNYTVSSGSSSLLISDAANPNGRSPVVGDCFTSHAFDSTCITPYVTIDTVWVVEQLVQINNNNVGIMPSATCCADPYFYKTRICDPQSGELQGTITAQVALLITDAANPNGRSPVVGDCYISEAGSVNNNTPLGYNTVWVVEELLGYSSTFIGFRQSAACCQTWDCKTDKFGSVACVDPGNGSGIYNNLQDCQNNCEPTEIVFEDNFRDVIRPWVDPGGGPCLHDIITCPCGFDYVQNWQPNPLHYPTGSILTGYDVCISPDYNDFHNALFVAGTYSTFHGVRNSFPLPCAELQGVYNPTVGMTIESSPTNPLGNYLAGSITTVINSVSTTYTWDKHVIVEINAAYNSSIINPNQMVIQSTPC
jgi:hypothetical protein